MSPPINIDGTDITGGTIDGTVFSEVTVDGTTVFNAIPDSVISLYDATEESSTGGISTVTDREGSRNLSGNLSVINGGIGGNQTYRLDGVDDRADTSDSFVTSNVDFAIIFVYQIQEANGSERHFFDGGSDLEFSLQDDSSGQLQVHRGGSTNVNTGRSPDNNAHIGVLQGFTGGNAELRIDGTAQGQISTADSDLTGLLWGDRVKNRTEPLEIDYGQFEVLSDYATSDIPDEESRLSTKWGITI